MAGRLNAHSDYPSVPSLLHSELFGSQGPVEGKRDPWGQHGPRRQAGQVHASARYASSLVRAELPAGKLRLGGHRNEPGVL